MLRIPFVICLNYPLLAVAQPAERFTPAPFDNCSTQVDNSVQPRRQTERESISRAGDLSGWRSRGVWWQLGRIVSTSSRLLTTY